tara:strand:+ start:23 stop:979 length:957 start_codon:yes stop_codon:yes gene_type:complete
MKNIYSNIVKVNNNNLSKAIVYLKKNDLIGVPTETVYGLAGNAYSKQSIKKIYNLKKRPSINPLIVHYYNIKRLLNDAVLNKNFFKIYDKFCPGPITFVLKKKKSSEISNLATAKLNTIAVRFPSNKVIRKLLKNINFPLAIPSANKSGGISPVSSKDVAEEFGNKLKLIIDDGNCELGIESTVIDLTGKIRVLRPGVISASKISKVIRSKVLGLKNSKNIIAPGSLKKHYSPGIPMKLNQKKSSNNHAFIVFGNSFKNTKNTFNLSKKSNLNEAAKNLYKIFRVIKNRNYKKIYVTRIPNKGIGIAINDRLKHASED